MDGASACACFNAANASRPRPSVSNADPRAASDTASLRASESVTDGYGRTWDVDNLVVADGGVFTSNAHKNPTLTIMALAWRSTDHLVQRMKRGEV